MLKPYIEKLMRGSDLTVEEAGAAVEALLQDDNASQAGAFLALLRHKGESDSELAGMARCLLNHSEQVSLAGPLLDIVGSGGDSAGTVNISTGAAILAAACGARVAKHGNRSVSSQCGSADVLEALGVCADLPASGVVRCLEETGYGFFYAPRFHPALKKIGAVRRALRLPTTFNLLGPLLNPANAPYRLVGVFDPALLMPMAKALQRLGVERALVVHGCGLDELSPLGSAQVVAVTQRSCRLGVIDPADFGMGRCQLADLKGGTRELNAALLRRAFEGEASPIGNALALNAGIALSLFFPELRRIDGVRLAQDVLARGIVAQQLVAIAACSQQQAVVS